MIKIFTLAHYLFRQNDTSFSRKQLISLDISGKQIKFAISPEPYRIQGCRNGGMVDTKDLKSFGLYRLCGFESHFLY